MAENIPVIDFSAYSLDRAKPDHDRFQGLIDDIHGALTTVGGLYLKNFGIPVEKIDNCFQTSTKFFEMPLEHKLKSEFSKITYSGYRGNEDEGLNENCEHKDLKETFILMPYEADQTFPDEQLPEFRKVLQELFDAGLPLQRRLLEVLARGLKLEDNQHFAKHHASMGKPGKSMTALRAAYYPPLNDVAVKPNQVSCGEHFDWDCISLIFQDSPGLEVLLDGRWISAPPKEGAVLMILGETMERWTAGKYMALKHRVVLPEDLNLEKPRQSVILFAFPDNAAPIEPIESSEQYPPLETFNIHISRRIAQYGA